ncbi:MAG: lipoyl(octanoyl) transferase LipB [Acidobacteria bacterium]|nr:lipoyl(octanoyl) transferase LipB [Acidobacteriota bacterium]
MTAAAHAAPSQAPRGTPPAIPATPGRVCEWRDLGRLGYAEAWRVQLEHTERLKAGADADVLLFVEHPHVVTLGRNAHESNILASPERLAALGVALEETDRGGDVTYHGPGQLVGYPLLDLKHWKRDVSAYMRALEEVLIRTLADYGLRGEREAGATGVWVEGAKVAAMGVHLSRWVTSHGFALNVDTDLSYFDHIIPCGLTRPVTSLERLLGEAPPRDEIRARILGHFGEVFGHTMQAAEQGEARP